MPALRLFWIDKFGKNDRFFKKEKTPRGSEEHRFFDIAHIHLRIKSILSMGQRWVFKDGLFSSYNVRALYSDNAFHLA